MTRIKICGLSRPEDIRAVNQAKPDYIGFVFAPGKRQVSLTKAAALRRELNPSIQVVGVFQNTDPAIICQAAKANIIDLVQLHGDENEAAVQKIRSMTQRPVIKAIAVRCRSDITGWQQSAAAFLLLDQGRGGTGRCFDWQLALPCGKPFFLAGGLNCANIGRAIEQVHPYAVDLSSGVETDGLKDPNKISAAVKLVRHLSTGTEHDEWRKTK